jgi:hypothetical protein
MTINDELGKIWEEATVVNFKGLYQILPGGTEKNYEIPQGSRFPDQETYLGPSKFQTNHSTPTLFYTNI